MNLLRVSVFAASALLLAGGYLASQVAFFAGLDPQNAQATADYAKAIDTPAVSAVALGILVACVVFASVRQEVAEE